MVTQLRDYRLTEGSLDQFVDEWLAGIAPLRRELGFRIEGAWKVEGESRFVWLLAHPGDWDAFEAADRGYYASPSGPGWTRIRPASSRIRPSPG